MTIISSGGDRVGLKTQKKQLSGEMSSTDRSGDEVPIETGNDTRTRWKACAFTSKLVSCIIIINIIMVIVVVANNGTTKKWYTTIVSSF